MNTKKATDPKKFRRRTELVELAEWLDEDGQPTVIEVQLVPSYQLVPIMKGLPASVDGADKSETFAESLDRLMKWAEPAVEIVKIGDKNRVFHFEDGEVEGKFPWKMVGITTQTEVIAGVLRVSGWGSAEPAGVDEFTRFRAEHGAGGPGGAPTSRVGEDAASPTPTP
jgi:hypothetical protein